MPGPLYIVSPAGSAVLTEELQLYIGAVEDGVLLDDVVVVGEVTGVVTGVEVAVLDVPDWNVKSRRLATQWLHFATK
jgi:hypothetical protein